MSEQLILRVARPYASEDEYIEAEGWSIDDKSILLVDQPELAKDTVVRFEVQLDDGSKPIRAEGRVYKIVAPSEDRPGGVKVRFRRFDASTKRFIDRVLAHRRKERRSRRPPPGAELEPLVLDPEPVLGTKTDPAPPREQSPPEQSTPEPSSPEPSSPEGSSPEQSSPEQSSPAQSAPAATAATAATRQRSPEPEPSSEPSSPEPSASRVRARASGDRPRVVSAPAHRDELLGRLRERAKKTAR